MFYLWFILFHSSGSFGELTPKLQSCGRSTPASSAAFNIEQSSPTSITVSFPPCCTVTFHVFLALKAKFEILYLWRNGLMSLLSFKPFPIADCFSRVIVVSLKAQQISRPDRPNKSCKDFICIEKKYIVICNQNLASSKGIHGKLKMT